MGVWKELKKNKPMLIGVIFGIVVLLYIVYKSSGANRQSGGSSIAPNQSTDPNAQGSQLGGYIQLDEIVNNPPAMTINVAGSSARAVAPPTRVNVGRVTQTVRTGGVHHHGPTHPPIHGIPPFLPTRPPKKTMIKSPVPLHTPPQHNTRVVVGRP